MSVPWESLANEHILGIAPYEPGKPIEELERELGIHDAIKLASNENPLAPVREGPAGGGRRAEPAQPLSGRHRLLPPRGPGPSPRRHPRPHHPGRGLQRADRARRAGLHAARRRGGDPPSLLRRLPDDRAGGGRDPGGGDAQGLPARPRGDGARHHAHDQDGLHRQPEQSHRHHRDRRRGGGLHGARARSRHRGVRRGLLRVRPGSRLSRLARLSAGGAQGRGPAHLLQGGQPGRAARGLRGGRSRLRLAAQPHPGALQRELAGAGGRARRPRGRRPHHRVPAHDRGRTRASSPTSSRRWGSSTRPRAPTSSWSTWAGTRWTSTSGSSARGSSSAPCSRSGWRARCA